MRLALRRLRSSPAFTIGATLTMAIAIGATASVFGLVDGVLLKALPYREPDRVMVVWERNVPMQLPKYFASVADYLDVKAQARSFTDLAAAQPFEGTVIGVGAPERVWALAVTPNYFPVLGITPVLGRGLALDSSSLGEAVIGYGYWQRHFGGAPSVLGTSLKADGESYTIVGVAPPGTSDQVELWVRWPFRPDEVSHIYAAHSAQVWGRLAPGVTPQAAERELNVIAGRLATAYPKTNQGWSMFVESLPDHILGDVRPALTMLLAAAACVLLIGAANLANLFLVRNLARERELAVRTALGATRGRLVRELVVEALVLGAGAAAIGVGLAVGGVRALRAFAPTGVSALPRIDGVGVDGRVVAFCVLATMATVVIFGVLPAWRASRGNPASAIKEGTRGTASGRHHRVQDALVVLQVAMALVLLTGTGLLVKTFSRFERADLGYRPDGVLTAHVAVDLQRYSTPERDAGFATQLNELLAAQPGVVSASVSSALPTNPSLRWFVSIAGDPAPEPGQQPTFRPYWIGPDYFRTMGIAMVRGRGILPSDGTHAAKVAVIDQRTADRFFATRDPIGRRILVAADTIEIVGVARSIRQGGLKADEVPVIYLALAQIPIRITTVAVALRTHGKPEALTATLQRTVATLDPLAPVSQVETLSAHVTEWAGTTRFSTFIASLFATVALILGLVGIYSVLSYIVRQRRREIGLRLALGATHAHVIRDVLRHALLLAAAGIAFGSIAAWWLTRGLAGMFVGVDPHDPTIFAGGALAFALVAVVAAAIPALRASSVSPVVVLQEG